MSPICLKHDSPRASQDVFYPLALPGLQELLPHEIQSKTQTVHIPWFFVQRTHQHTFPMLSIRCIDFPASMICGKENFISMMCPLALFQGFSQAFAPMYRSYSEARPQLSANVTSFPGPLLFSIHVLTSFCPSPPHGSFCCDEQGKQLLGRRLGTESTYFKCYIRM